MAARSIVLAFSACALVACGACPGRGRAHESGPVLPGYVLFAPLLSTTTYLVDREGRVVHTWDSELAPGVSAYLLDDGHLLRTGRDERAPAFHAAGAGGRIQELDWGGRVLWDWTIASRERRQHHDIEPLPNGDVLLVAWEAKTRDEALRAGRHPARVGAAGLWPECVLEVRPVPPGGGEIVWEWHMWDHLAVDANARARIDVNGGRAPESVSESVLDRLRSLGYLAGGATVADVEPDFAHADAVDYDPRFDRVLLTVNQYGEVWLIDHRPATRAAAGPAGDLLWRWGAAAGQRLHGPHDGRFIPAGRPGAGHVLIFDNGDAALRPWSRVVEVDLSRPGAAPTWEYTAPRRRSFFAEFISGAERLANGNTLITDGPRGRFFEVTPRGGVAWTYDNPFTGRAPNPSGDPAYSIFRATFIPADHPGLRGRDLRPSK